MKNVKPKESGHVQDLSKFIEDNKASNNGFVRKRLAFSRKLLRYRTMQRLNPDVYRAMLRAWGEIDRQGIKPLELLSFVANAHDAAEQEGKRPAIKDEALHLDDVEAKLKNLRQSIKKATDAGALPAGKAWLLELDAPNETAWFGFSGMRPDMDRGFMQFELIEAIEAGLLALRLHRDGLHGRFTKRGRKDAVRAEDQRAFIRALVLSLRHSHGVTLPATVAAIANAIYAPQNPWDAAAVVSAAKGLPMPVRVNGVGNKGKKQSR